MYMSGSTAEGHPSGERHRKEGWVKRALQLLSKRYWYIRFAHVHERERQARGKGQQPKDIRLEKGTERGGGITVRGLTPPTCIVPVRIRTQPTR